MKVSSVTLTPDSVIVGQTFLVAVEVVEPTWEYYRQFTWAQIKEMTWGELCHKSERPWKRSGAFHCGEDYYF